MEKLIVDFLFCYHALAWAALAKKCRSSMSLTWCQMIWVMVLGPLEFIAYAAIITILGMGLTPLYIAWKHDPWLLLQIPGAIICGAATVAGLLLSAYWLIKKAEQCKVVWRKYE